MFRHYLRTAIRNLWRSRGYSLINILGLAIGIATCLLIFLYILHELGYEKKIPGYENIYRVQVRGRFADDFFNVPLTPGGLAPNLKEVVPEAEAVTRIQKAGQFTVAYEDKKFYEDKIYFVDSSFFDVISLPAVSGDIRTSLMDPFSIVMTESTAKKYFGNEDPIGKTVRANNKGSLKVTAVLKDLPENMHMKFDILVPLKAMLLQTGQTGLDQDWGSISLYTYARFSGPVSKDDIDDKIRMMIRDAFGEEADQYNMEMIPYLMPMAKIHLHSNLMAELEPSSNISYIYTFSAIALFILVIACINFMNLATARSAKRAREVGLRKVSGAARKQLVFQYLGESFLMSILAGIIAIVLAELAFPLFNKLAGLELSYHDYRLPIIGMMLLLVLVVGLLAGIYPSFVLSSFRPIEAMKGDLYRGHGRSIARNLLVLVQFSVSILLIVSTLLIYRQMNFIRGKDLGYRTEDILIMPLRSEEVAKKADVLKNEFLSLPEVQSVSLTDGIPGMSMSGIGFYPEGGDVTSPWIIYILEVDEEFIPVMDMQLLAGRNFSQEFGTDTTAVVINEALRDRLGWDDPIGKKIYQFGQGDNPPVYTIIGVVKNYHFKSLHDAVEPSMMLLRNDDPGFIALRMKPVPKTLYLESLEEKWNGIETAFPFDYMVLHEDLTRQYSQERNMGRLFIFFTVLAIFIACLGLFGLASFSAQRRTKEIGIRKVLGAPAGTIIFSLGKEFTRWVLIANVVAWPVAYLLIDRWLQTFAFRIDIRDNLWAFPAAGIIALLIALTTVVGQAIRAASMNPAETVKYE